MHVLPKIFKLAKGKNKNKQKQQQQQQQKQNPQLCPNAEYDLVAFIWWSILCHSAKKKKKEKKEKKNPG